MNTDERGFNETGPRTMLLRLLLSLAAALGAAVFVLLVLFLSVYIRPLGDLDILLA